MQALSESASPQSLGPASQRLPSGLKYDSVSGYAKAAALTGGKQLLGLGEAGYKYVSSQYGQWRSGTWEGASTRCGMLPHPPSAVVLQTDPDSMLSSNSALASVTCTTFYCSLIVLVQSLARLWQLAFAFISSFNSTVTEGTKHGVQGTATGGR